ASAALGGVETLARGPLPPLGDIVAAAGRPLALRSLRHGGATAAAAASRRPTACCAASPPPGRATAGRGCPPAPLQRWHRARRSSARCRGAAGRPARDGWPPPGSG